MIFRVFILFLFCFSVSEVLTGQLVPYKRNGLWGYMNTKGQKVITPAFLTASVYSEGLSLVSNSDGLIGFIDDNGKWIIPPRFHEAQPFLHGLSRVRLENKWGLINSDGQWVENPVYSDSSAIKYIGEGWWALGYQGRNGLVNHLGIRRTYSGLEWVDRFINGFCAISCGNGQMGYLNRLGLPISPLNLSLGLPPFGFYEGRARIYDNQKIGFIDTLGRTVVPATFAFAQDFNEGLAVVRRSDIGSSLFIKKDGTIGIPDPFDWASSFLNGLAHVKSGKFQGLIEKSGAWVIKVANSKLNILAWNSQTCVFWDIEIGKLKFMDIRSKKIIEHTFDDYSLLASGYWVVKNGAMKGLLDKSGKTILNTSYDDIDFLGGSYYKLFKNQKYGLIDSSGKLLLAPNYSDVRLINNMIQVEQEHSLWGFYDMNGKLLLPAQYSEVSSFSQGKSIIRLPDVFNARFINKQGKTIKEIPYQRISSPSFGLYRIEYQKKYGFMDGNGKVLIPANLLIAEPFRQGFSIAAQPGRNGRDTLWGLLNTKGKWAITPRNIKLLSLNEGLILARENVGSTDFRYGYLNLKGEWAFRRRFSAIEPFFEGYSIVRQNYTDEFSPIENMGEELISKLGNPTISFNTNIRPLGGVGDGFITVTRNDSLGWMDLKGQWVVRPRWALQPGQEEAQAFSGGRLAIRQNGFWGYLKPDGNWAIEPRFLEAEPYHAGYARVRTPSGWGLVDTAGKWVLPPVQYEIGDWAEGTVAVRGRLQGQRIGYLDRNGKKVWPLLP